jgi:purine-binding chemotaxis protein CheW
VRELLCFSLGSEEYGIDLASVHAISSVAGLHSVPETPSFLRGVIPSPLGPVPLVDLARKFNLATEAAPERPTAAIVETRIAGEPSAMAILIGESSRVVEVEPGRIEPPPELGAGIRAEFLKGVVRVEDRTVLIIDLGPSLSATEVEALEGLRADYRDADDPETVVESRLTASAAAGASSVDLDRSEHLVFSISGVSAGFRLTEISELVRLGSVMPLPGVPRWVCGVTNVRGQVIPVVDTAALVGLPSAPATSRTCGIIADVRVGERSAAIAFVVDDVLQVVAPASDEIDLPASVGLPLPAEHVKGVARCGEGFVALLSPAALVPGALFAASEQPAAG